MYFFLFEKSSLCNSTIEAKGAIEIPEAAFEAKGCDEMRSFFYRKS
jgi:hypothetical protein